MSATENVTAEDFARHVERSNPFSQDRVTQVQTSQTDVPSIHEKAFKKLVRRIDEVRTTGQTAGILLTGPAGVGKSHVLARLFRWAREEGRATVVYLHNLLASPERTGRYLLHATVNELAGTKPANFAQSELYRLINMAIGARLDSKKKSLPSVATRKAILQKIGEEIDPDDLVMPVFITYLEQAVGAHLAEEAAEARALAAVQWLSGETIDAEIAKTIGLHVNGEDGAAIPDDVGVQRTLDVICRLCACANRPFVLCLDQVDNLSEERVHALMSFLHAVIDNGRNLVVVTCGVRASMIHLEQTAVIPTAAADRVMQHRINLDFISMKEACAIVAERIEKFCAPYAGLKELASAREKDPLTPLSSKWWERYSGGLIETRPRDVIRAARDAWEVEQERLGDEGIEPWLKSLGKAQEPSSPSPKPLPPLDERIDQLIGLKLVETLNARRLHPARLPPDADNLAALTLTLLEVCLGVPGYTLRGIERARNSATYDLWVTEESPAGELVASGLRFFTLDSPLSATNALKRLLQDESPRTHQILVTDEERRPLRPGPKGRDCLEELTKRPRFEHVKLTFDDHAMLDALSSVLGAARVGDLDVESEPGVYRAITEDECRASLHRKRAFLEHPLLRLLLTEELAPKTQRLVVGPTQLKLLRDQIRGELAMALSMTAREMAAIIISHTGQSLDVFPKLWEMVKVVAHEMHQEQQLFVDAVDDDLYLQLA